MNILEFRNVSLFYNKTQVLFDINLEVPMGKITSLVGQSGSGKSTIFKSIFGFFRKSDHVQIQGEILFKNQKLLTGKEHKIQPVFQEPSLYFHRGWSMEKCLREPLILRGIDPKTGDSQILELLDVFSISSKRLPDPIQSFSGGELQRLGMIRALLADPEFLVMDEPVSGLDRSVLEDTISYLFEILEKRKITIFVISHDLEFVSKISDFVAVISQGKILEQGQKESIFSNPKHPYTRELIDSRILSGLF